MLPALGALSSALDALQSLGSTTSSSHKHAGSSRKPANPFELPDNAGSANAASPPVSGLAQISPATMSALIAAQSQSSAGTTVSAPASASDALKDLFSMIDGNGNGKVTKSEFEDALGAGGTNLANADEVFGKLDRDGDGTVTLGELSSALRGRGHHHAHGPADGAGQADRPASDPLLQALQGASSSSVTNGDGSTTISVTYADGSKVTTTSPASSTGSGTATSSYNFIERLIAREAQAISASANAPLSLLA